MTFSNGNPIAARPKKAFIVTRVSDFYQDAQKIMWELGYIAEEQMRSIKEAVERLMENPVAVVVDQRFEKVAKGDLQKLIMACKKLGIAIHIILEALKLKPLLAERKLQSLTSEYAKEAAVAGRA